MKILAFEHVTGGGMLGDPRMPALAAEGDAMLRALADDLEGVSGIKVLTLRDPRASREIASHAFAPATAAEFWTVFRRALAACDAAWPIAPESDGILLRLTNEILASGRPLLNSRPGAVRVAASKRATHEMLQRNGIPSIPCYDNEESLPADCVAVVAKPDDGAGCLDTFLFPDRPSLRAWLRANPSAACILQPFVAGESRSLSLVRGESTVRLLSCNRQKLAIEGERLRFEGVDLAAVRPAGRYEALAARICDALPGLWGYCGVDFIETAAGPVVVEINPRLTTSYVGLRQATGWNPAALVLAEAGLIDESEGLLPAQGHASGVINA